MTTTATQPALRRVDGAKIVKTECTLAIYCKLKAGRRSVVIDWPGGVPDMREVVRAIANRLGVTPAELPKVLGL